MTEQADETVAIKPSRRLTDQVLLSPGESFTLREGANENAIIYMTKQTELTTDSLDRPALEITPAMIEAGAAELRERCLGEPLEEIVRSVFYVMMAAA